MRAREKLKNKWFICAGVTFFLFIVPLILNYWIYVATLVIFLLFSVGFACFYLEIAKEEPLRLSNLFITFKSKQYLWKSVLITIIYMIVVSIGLFFLIVPGIVLALMFSQIFFVLADNPSISIFSIYKRSFVMTFGKKRELLCLSLTFMGWMLLGIVTLGIGLLFAIPYFLTGMAEFHLSIRPEQQE